MTVRLDSPEREGLEPGMAPGQLASRCAGVPFADKVLHGVPRTSSEFATPRSSLIHECRNGVCNGHDGAITIRKGPIRSEVRPGLGEMIDAPVPP